MMTMVRDDEGLRRAVLRPGLSADRRGVLREWWDVDYGCHSGWSRPFDEELELSFSKLSHPLLGNGWDLGHDWDWYPGLRYLYEVRGEQATVFIDPLYNSITDPRPPNLLNDGWYFVPWHDLLLPPGTLCGPLATRDEAEARWTVARDFHNRCVEDAIAAAGLMPNSDGCLELCREPLLRLLETAGDIIAERATAQARLSSHLH
jgi:hypothetical protein